MNVGLAIALVGLLLVGAVLFIGLVTVVAVGWFWMARRAEADDVQLLELEKDELATEVFQPGSLLAFYDADEHDRTEQLHLDGGILIDGTTDPAAQLTGVGRVVAKKK